MLPEEYRNKNYYEILGLARDATELQIRDVYQDLARRYDPESEFRKENHGPEATDHERDLFRVITTAYETLVDFQKRIEYDLALPHTDFQWGDTVVFKPGQGDILSQLKGATSMETQNSTELPQAVPEQPSQHEPEEAVAAKESSTSEPAATAAEAEAPQAAATAPAEQQLEAAEAPAEEPAASEFTAFRKGDTLLMTPEYLQQIVAGDAAGQPQGAAAEQKWSPVETKVLTDVYNLREELEAPQSIMPQDTAGTQVLNNTHNIQAILVKTGADAQPDREGTVVLDNIHNLQRILQQREQQRREPKPQRERPTSEPVQKLTEPKLVEAKPQETDPSSYKNVSGVVSYVPVPAAQARNTNSYKIKPSARQVLEPMHRRNVPRYGARGPEFDWVLLAVGLGPPLLTGIAVVIYLLTR